MLSRNKCYGLQPLLTALPNKPIKGATSRFEHLENVSLTFSSSLFVIHINLHSKPSYFLYGLLLSLWCFSILVNYYFQVSFIEKVILYKAKITQKKT